LKFDINDVVEILWGSVIEQIEYWIGTDLR